jgi:hypothetical protein
MRLGLRKLERAWPSWSIGCMMTVSQPEIVPRPASCQEEVGELGLEWSIAERVERRGGVPVAQKPAPRDVSTRASRIFPRSGWINRIVACEQGFLTWRRSGEPGMRQ